MLTGDELGTRSRDDVLAAVYREGGRRRLHRRLAWLSAIGVLVVLAIAVPITIAGGDGDDGALVADDRGIDDDPTTTTVGTSSTSVPGTTATTTLPTSTTPTTNASTATTATTATTTTADPCRNSHDPACGDFRWDPEPVDQPTEISFEVSPALPVAGQPVMVTVTATDADAPVSTNCGSYSWNDAYSTEPEIGFSCAVTSCLPNDRYGPWDPPAPQPGSYSDTFTHTFSQPGSYSFHFETGYDPVCPPGNPYQKPASSSVVIYVAAY